jgi:hypothetical protein
VKWNQLAEPFLMQCYLTKAVVFRQDKTLLNSYALLGPKTHHALNTLLINKNTNLKRQPYHLICALRFGD